VWRIVQSKIGILNILGDCLYGRALAELWISGFCRRASHRFLQYWRICISFMWDATLIQTCKNLKCSTTFPMAFTCLVLKEAELGWYRNRTMLSVRTTLRIQYWFWLNIVYSYLSRPVQLRRPLQCRPLQHRSSIGHGLSSPTCSNAFLSIVDFSSLRWTSTTCIW
jgi:hypothetical protein